MTEQNGNKIAPAEKPPAQGKRELSANRQDDKPVANWRVRALAVAGMFGAVAACGGSGETNDPILPDNPLPAGVCSNIESRVTPVGVTEVSLNEAILDETAPNNKVKLGNDAYRLQVLEITMDGADSDVKVIITDSAGNPVAFLEDQNGDRTANVNYLEAGDSWTFVLPDGSKVTVTVCAIYEDLEGNQHVVLYSEGFDWCSGVDRTVENSDNYETGTYGTQHITNTVHETGETVDRDDAQCLDLTRVILEETTTLEVPMQPGNQPADSAVKLLGTYRDVITLSNSGYVLLGMTQVIGEVEVGETLIGTGISVLVNEVSLYGGAYEADISINVGGVEFEVIEGARAGDVFKVTDSEGREMYVRVNSVSPDGKVELQVMENPKKLQDGGTYTDASGNVWRVELAKIGGDVSNGITGWHLVKQEE